MNKKKKRILAFVIMLVVMVVLIIPMAATSIIYEKNFGVRYETRGWWINDISDYEGLAREKTSIVSDKGQKLAAYTYYNKDTMVPKGVVVLAHGLGAGHMAYMNQIDYLTKNDFLVFTYDVTGNDESEGRSIKGIPQAVIDLDKAITYVENNDKFKGLPIMLYGHSWGGYAVSTVLNYDHDISAVVEMSGFNSSQDIILEKGQGLYGGIINVLSPYIKVYEWLKFGDVSKLTALDGFKKTNAKVLLIHGDKDKTVSYTNNFKKYMSILGDDNDFTFERADNYGHQIAFSKEYNKKVSAYKKEAISVYGDINSIPEEAQQELIDTIKSLPDKLNNERMEGIVQFYNEVINQDYEY